MTEQPKLNRFQRRMLRKVESAKVQMAEKLRDMPLDKRIAFDTFAETNLRYHYHLEHLSYACFKKKCEMCDGFDCNHDCHTKAAAAGLSSSLPGPPALLTTVFETKPMEEVAV